MDSKIGILVHTRRPAGVTACATLFFVVSGYLLLVAIVLLVHPGVLPLAVGAPLLEGLEIAGPYMFLIMGVVAALVGWGLLRLNNWARRAAALAAAIGVAALLPRVSGDVLNLESGNLIWSGLGIASRMLIVSYLYRPSVSEAFQKV